MGRKLIVSAQVFCSKIHESISFSSCGTCIMGSLAHSSYLLQRSIGQLSCDEDKSREGSNITSYLNKSNIRREI